MTADPMSPFRHTPRRSMLAAGLAVPAALGFGQAVTPASRAPLLVTDAGAVGDGVTDDTAAVRAAVATAISESRALVFPPGTYLVDAPIQVKDAPYFVIEMHGRLKRRDDSVRDSLLQFYNCDNLVAPVLRTDGNAVNNGRVQSDGKWYPVDEVKHDVRLDASTGVWIGLLDSVNSAADALYLAGGDGRCEDVRIEHLYAHSDGSTGRSAVSVVAGDNLQFGSIRSRNVGCNTGVLVMPGGFQIEPNSGDTVSNVVVDSLIVHTAGATGLGLWSQYGKYVRNVRIGSCRIHKQVNTHPNGCDVNIRGVVGASIAHIAHTSDPSNTNQALSIDSCDDIDLTVDIPRLGTRPVNIGASGMVTGLRLRGRLADSSSHLLLIYNLNDSVIDVTLRDAGSASMYLNKSYYGTSARVRFRGDWRKGSRGAICIAGSGQIDEWLLEDIDMGGWPRDTRIKQGGVNYLHKIRKSRVNNLTNGTTRPYFDVWGQGDFVENLTPVELGTTGSRYVVRGWVCTGSGYGTSSTWAECRHPTGT
jgi:hypothetical protein